MDNDNFFKKHFSLDLHPQHFDQSTPINHRLRLLTREIRQARIGVGLMLMLILSVAVLFVFLPLQDINKASLSQKDETRAAGGAQSRWRCETVGNRGLKNDERTRTSASNGTTLVNEGSVRCPVEHNLSGGLGDGDGDGIYFSTNWCFHGPVQIKTSFQLKDALRPYYWELWWMDEGMIGDLRANVVNGQLVNAQFKSQNVTSQRVIEYQDYWQKFNGLSGRNDPKDPMTHSCWKWSTESNVLTGTWDGTTLKFYMEDYTPYTFTGAK